MAATNETSELQRHFIAALLDSGISREALIRTVNTVHSQRIKTECGPYEQTKELNEVEHKLAQPENGVLPSEAACGTSSSAAAADHDPPQSTPTLVSNQPIHGEPVVDQLLR